MPGYMVTYAIGASAAADLRARVKEVHGPYAEGDPTWYAWMSDRLYRFGLERPSRRVLEDFLGRPLSPRALLDDLARAGVRPTASPCPFSGAASRATASRSRPP
jgi:Zn-dependent M32 family carboxypeptidase